MECLGFLFKDSYFEFHFILSFLFTELLRLLIIPLFVTLVTDYVSHLFLVQLVIILCICTLEVLLFLDGYCLCCFSAVPPI